MNSEARTSSFRACQAGGHAFCLAGLLLAAGAAFRAPASTNTQDFTIDAWQTEDGLPQSSVLSIVQTPDGYLWLATYAGLARFDGIRFTVFDSSNVPGLPGNRITGLHVDDSGALWVVTEYHDLAQMMAGRCRVWTRAEGVPAAGVAWIGSVPARRHNLQTSEASPGVTAGAGNSHSPANAAEPGPWMASSDGGIYRYRAGRFTCAAEPTGLGIPNRVIGIFADDDGSVWLHQANRLARLEKDGFKIMKTSAGDELIVKCVCP